MVDSITPEKMAAIKAALAKSELTAEDLLADKFAVLPDIKKQDLSSKVVVITGANIGVGYETAKSIATMGPKKLILACRNLEKANPAAETIKKETGCNTVEVWPLDLSSFDSINAFAKKFNDSGLPLDIMVGNAGCGFQPTDKAFVNENGFELTIQVNHIGHMLLILLLTPALKKSSAPRINIVASEIHYMAASPDVNDPTPVTTTLKKPTLGLQQYGASKLLNVLFVTEYANRCPYNVWICSSTPGFTDSQIGTKDENGNISHDLPKDPLNLPKRSTYDGAKTVIYASVYPELLQEKKGVYITSMKIKPARTTSQDPTFAKNTWNDTMNILKPFVDHSSIEDWAWKQ